jgi:hypothetical protein
MRARTHLTIAAALAIMAIGAPAATAMPADPTAGEKRADMHASTVTKPDVARESSDARGEHAASLADTPAVPDSPTGDRRTPDAVEPFVRPVVVEVGDPVAPGFDWVAAIVGLAGGLGLAVLAGAAVSGGRRRRPRPSTV